MTNLTKTTVSTNHHPLWSLIRAGLDHIETQEAELQKRLLASETAESDLSEAARQLELTQIIARTDRMRRMLIAMSPILN